MMTTMGALGLGVGIVGGDMSDTLKGLGAGLTAGYATGGKLNSAVGNTITGNNAVGRFLDDAIRGTGPERQRSDYIRSYISNPENRNVAHALTKMDMGLPHSKEAAIAKCYASDIAMEVASEAIQMFGGYGYSREYPVEKLLRDAKIFQIFEGSNEIQRIVVANNTIGR